VIGFMVAAMTAFYMFRLYHLTFGGTFRGTPEQAAHVHESPSSMIVPLQVLAVGSILAGLVGGPAILGKLFGIPNLFQAWVDPVFESAHLALAQVQKLPAPGHEVEWILMAASVGVGAAGIFVAWQFYRAHPEIPVRLGQSLAPIHRVLYNKYYVDELYDALF